MRASPVARPPALRVAARRPQLPRGAGSAMATPARSAASAPLFGLADDDAVPELIVFDCDACLWSPEMFQLPEPPSGWDAAAGGVRAGRAVVRLFGGVVPAFAALAAHPRLAATRVGLASSTRQPHYADAVLRHMRLDPTDATSSLGSRVSFREIYPIHVKSAHFGKLKAASGVSYERMLFFDDCNWSDNCGEVMRLCPGVVGLATPDGLTAERFAAGLLAFARADRLRRSRAARDA